MKQAKIAITIKRIGFLLALKVVSEIFPSETKRNKRSCASITPISAANRYGPSPRKLSLSANPTIAIDKKIPSAVRRTSKRRPFCLSCWTRGSSVVPKRSVNAMKRRYFRGLGFRIISAKRIAMVRRKMRRLKPILIGMGINVPAAVKAVAAVR